MRDKKLRACVLAHNVQRAGVLERRNRTEGEVIVAFESFQKTGVKKKDTPRFQREKRGKGRTQMNRNQDSRELDSNTGIIATMNSMEPSLIHLHTSGGKYFSN